MSKQVCKFCDNPFEGRRDAQFCSSPCKNDYYKKHGFPQKNNLGNIETVGAENIQPLQTQPSNLPTVPQGDGSLIQMLYLEAKQDLKSEREITNKLRDELSAIKVEKGTWEKLNELNEAKVNKGLSGLDKETEGKVIDRLMDMGETFLASKMGDKEEETQLLAGLSEDSQTMILGIVELLKTLEPHMLASMNIIVDHYSHKENMEIAMQQYAVIKGQQEQKNTSSAPNTGKPNVAHY